MHYKELCMGIKSIWWIVLLRSWMGFLWHPFLSVVSIYQRLFWVLEICSKWDRVFLLPSWNLYFDTESDWNKLTNNISSVRAEIVVLLVNCCICSVWNTVEAQSLWNEQIKFQRWMLERSSIREESDKWWSAILELVSSHVQSPVWCIVASTCSTQFSALVRDTTKRNLRPSALELDRSGFSFSHNSQLSDLFGAWSLHLKKMHNSAYLELSRRLNVMRCHFVQGLVSNRKCFIKWTWRFGFILGCELSS